ncbi:hypothetical protein ACWDYH_37150 [Nocardia goodfellowii]
MRSRAVQAYFGCSIGQKSHNTEASVLEIPFVWVVTSEVLTHHIRVANTHPAEIGPSQFERIEQHQQIVAATPATVSEFDQARGFRRATGWMGSIDGDDDAGTGLAAQPLDRIVDPVELRTGPACSGPEGELCERRFAPP